MIQKNGTHLKEMLLRLNDKNNIIEFKYFNINVYIKKEKEIYYFLIDKSQFETKDLSMLLDILKEHNIFYDLEDYNKEFVFSTLDFKDDLFKLLSEEREQSKVMDFLIDEYNRILNPEDKFEASNMEVYDVFNLLYKTEEEKEKAIIFLIRKFLFFGDYDNDYFYKNPNEKINKEITKANRDFGRNDNEVILSRDNPMFINIYLYKKLYNLFSNTGKGFGLLKIKNNYKELHIEIVTEDFPVILFTYYDVTKGKVIKKNRKIVKLPNSGVGVIVFSEMFLYKTMKKIITEIKNNFQY